MASSKKNSGGATLAAPAPAATALPALPEGFERIIDDDGEELVRPTPTRAVAELLDVLKAIPAWERFPEDPGEWTPSQIRERGRPMPGYVLVTGTDEDGKACRVEVGADAPVVRAWARVEEARSSTGKKRGQREGRVREWEATAKAWERLTGRRFPKTEPKFVRSAIDERRQMVQGLRTGLDVFVPQAIAAAGPGGSNEAALRELERDAELCRDTVDAAVTALRKLTASADELDVNTAKAETLVPPAAQVPDLGHAERATLAALRKGARTTRVLNDKASTKRARERLGTLQLIEPCGSGKSKRGVWKLTAFGFEVLQRIDAGE